MHFFLTTATQNANAKAMGNKKKTFESYDFILQSSIL